MPAPSTLEIVLETSHNRPVTCSVAIVCWFPSCTVCGYSTKYFSSVQVHARTHTNEKPFACSFCPYASAQLSNLKKHVAIHLKKEAVARADAARVASKLRNPSEIDVNGNGLSEPGDESAENAVEAKPGVLTRRAVALSVQAGVFAVTTLMILIMRAFFTRCRRWTTRKRRVKVQKDLRNASMSWTCQLQSGFRHARCLHTCQVSRTYRLQLHQVLECSKMNHEPPRVAGVGFQPVVIPHRYVTTDTLAGAPGRLPPAPLPSMVYYPSHAPYYPPVMAQAEVPTTLTHATLNVAAIQQYAPHVRRVSMHTSYGTVDTHVERKATGPLVPQSFVTSTSYVIVCSCA